MKKKMMPHIIAAGVFVVFIVLGLACASTPKAPPPPKEIVYSSNTSIDQLATLFIPPGSIEVILFDGIQLKQKWYQASLKDPGLNVKIAEGKHNIVFHYYGGEYGATMKNIKLDINLVAGRSYRLFYLLTDYDLNLFSGRGSEKVLFTVLEVSETREPGPNEQVFSIINNESFAVVVLDKGTSNERLISLAGPPILMLSTVYPFTAINELRIIISKGEHTIDVLPHPGSGLALLEPASEQPRFFTASSEPIRYLIKIGQITGKGKDSKATYTITRK